MQSKKGVSVIFLEWLHPKSKAIFCLALSVGPFLAFFVAAVLGSQTPTQRQAVSQSATSPNPGSGMASVWLKNLKNQADKLDDCTYKGRFSSKDAVPDECNGAYLAARDLRSNDGLLSFLHHGCSKWRSPAMSEKNKRDCEELGRGYWHLQEAIDRARVADSGSTEREMNTSIGDAASRYVSNVNPGEVSQQAEILRELNTELEKPQINPGFAFLAGKIDTEFETWMINHCPAELAWGIPAREYVSALTACSNLEPEVQRFERNVLRLTSYFRPAEKR
jgi:hypothetical protein